MLRKKIIKNILITIFWSAIGAGTIVLLVAAIQRKDARRCTGIDIVIKGATNNVFVDKNDVLNTVVVITGGKPLGKPVGSFDLKAMETALQGNVWVKSAELFFDNNEKLQVNVLEREPLARVFTAAGTSFYVDSAAAMLPLSEKFSARLPVFTNFPSDKKVLIKADSNLLRDILTVSAAIQEDPFYMSMIDQVDITVQRTFEMMPKFGNTVIIFGDAKNARDKLNKLRLFYREVVVKAGWNKYSEINVQFANQVVGKRKEAQEVKADSLRTLQLMKIIAENAERLAGDSSQTIIQDNEHNTTNSSLIQQSIEREDNASSDYNAEELPAGDTGLKKPITPAPGKDRSPKLPDHPGTSVKKPVLMKPVNRDLQPGSKAAAPGVKTPKLIMLGQMPKKPVTKKPGNDY